MRYSWQTTLPPDDGRRSGEWKRILIVSIECTEEASRTPMLAPAFLVAHARRDPYVRSRVEFEIRQFSALEPIETIAEEILASDYDAIGLSCYVWNFGVCEQLIPVLKNLCPRTLLIIGGPQLLGQETEIFDRMPELDILVYRDGEPAFAEIARQIATGARDWSAIGGILFRSGGATVNTLERKNYLRFAEVASPYLEKVITGDHPNLFLETYRGCPYTCAFCAWGGDEGPKSDLLPLDRIHAELDAIRSMGANTIGFFDSNFNQPPPRAEAIYDIMLETDQIQVIGMSIFAQTLKESLVEKMSRRGTRIGVGLQSSDAEVNSVMKRRFRDGPMSTGVHLLKKHNIQFVLQVIIGLPGDTFETLVATLKYALSFEPPAIDAFRLMLLPGTEYRRRAEDYKIVFEPRPYHYVISNYSMNAREINRAERMAQALTVFYNLPQTRQEMFRQAGETGEDIIDFCDALGTFADRFDLLDRKELRKGDIIRTKDEHYLLKVLDQFQRYRGELAMVMQRDQLVRELAQPASEYSYIPIQAGSLSVAPRR